jgi:hypothetical protein
MSDDLTPDEVLVLRSYRTAKREGHGDIEVGVKDGALIKLHKTEKTDIKAELDRVRRLREVVTRPPSP